MAALDNLKAKTRDEELTQRRQVVAELDLRITDKEKDVGRYKRLVEVDKTLPEKRLEEVMLDLSTLKAQRESAAAKLAEGERGATKTEIAIAEARVKEAQVAVKTTQDDLRDILVKAPFDGLIVQRFKSTGDYIAATPPTEVFEIVSLDELEVEFRLPEGDYARLTEGATKVRLNSPMLKSGLDATLTRIVREIDAAKGTFACRVAVPGASSTGLLPGAFVTAEIELALTTGDVIIPQRAVVTDGGKSWVFVVEEGKMAQRRVELGDRLTEGVLVKSGLREREKVMVGPADQMKDGAAVPVYLIVAPASAPATQASRP